MLKGKVIACFPCTGKTSLAHTFPDIMYDHDMYDFKYGPKFLRECWVTNYFSKLKIMKERFDFVFVNAIPDILSRESYFKEDIEDLTVIIPSRQLKHEYIGRAFCRTSSNRFMEILDTEWDSWLDEIDKLDYYYKQKLGLTFNKITLPTQQYVSDWWQMYRN
jgi:hypothetical protein